MIAKLFRAVTHRSSSLRKAVWKLSYEYLAKTYRQGFWRFMNYGYAPLDSSSTGVALDDEDEADRFCIQLYHEVANSIPLAGLHVLEVGCGRGGGASYMARYLKPASLVGVDFSEAVVAFCRQHHAFATLSFVKGDAENLPFESNRFDAVVNVESSHCYASMPRFLSEVKRVLKPGGFFLFADLRGKDQTKELRKDIDTSGMRLIEEKDITANVLRALELDTDRKDQLIRKIVKGPLRKYFRDFAGIRETGVYRRFWNGENVYLKCVLQKAA